MSLATGDLTTLATAKSYLASSVPSDQVLSGLITRISRWILNEINRPFILPKTYTEYYNGSGTSALVLPNWPLLNVSSLYVGGAAIQQAPFASGNISYNGSGWSFQAWTGVPPGEPAILELNYGLGFCYGIRNIAVAYSAGYQVTNEATVVGASPYQAIPVQPYGQWASDQGVTYSDGTALVAVSSGPNMGEYVPPNPNSGIYYYQFNLADAGADVLLSYGFVPSDLEQVVLEMIAERASYRTRPGVRSQMLAAQETIVYDNSGLSAATLSILGSYKSVLPPAMGYPV